MWAHHSHPRRQYDLARLLLCNGFLPDSEPESLLNLVVRSRTKDFLELLLAWGADPKRILAAYQAIVEGAVP